MESNILQAVELFTFVVSRNDVELERMPGELNSLCVFRYFEKCCCTSPAWSIAMDGYKIEVINEQTGERKNWGKQND